MKTLEDALVEKLREKYQFLISDLFEMTPYDAFNLLYHAIENAPPYPKKEV